MATAPAFTFVDSPAEPAILLPGLPRAEGDTITEVIADPVRRNKLINDNNFLKGIRMTPSGPQPSSRELIVRPETLNAIIINRATIETTTVEAEFTQQLMHSNYNSVSVKVSAPYVTATAEYSNETSYKNTETEKTVLVSSRYLFPQGRIDFGPPGSGFKDDVVLSTTFTDAIDSALSKSTLNDRREALHNVFQEFGDVFRTKVMIGGTLSAHTMETYSRTENETSVKQDIKAGLEVAVQKWGTGATTGHGNMETTITTKEGRTLDVKYIVEGGDYTKILETEEWIASTSKSEFWRVNEVAEVIPIVDMLPEPVRSIVKTLMIPLLGRWIDVEIVPGTDRFPVKIYRPKHTLPAGWHWLGHTAEASKALIVKATLGPNANRNAALTLGRDSSGFTDQPFPNMPQYSFLSTYFGGYFSGTAPDSELCALRPGLFLEGRWELHPQTAQSPDDECFDLQPVIRVKQPGTENPPKPRWALRKNVVLFDSE